jgi:penicillin amidase
MKRLIFGALLLLALLAAAGVGSAIWFRGQLSSSLPQLDGTHQLPGLSATVTVTRDDLGIPTIRGNSRTDVARATGFLHGQDRFFQMDLSRRRAAGELSALVGSRALVLDRAIRIHRFRAEAHRALALLKPADRQVLDAYTEGVNNGLRSLSTRPFEYVLLRQQPQPWLAEDSLLVVLSMFITLQDPDALYESTLATMHDLLPAAVFEFMAPRGTEWDSPVEGAAFQMPAVPGPDVFNPRARAAGHPPAALHDQTQVAPSRLEREGGSWNAGLALAAFGARDHDAIGSNNWAVDHTLTADGAALLANDMHLGIRVPNTWYRARLEWPAAADPSRQRTLTGVTLPGMPTLVAGSNTQVAWGFTNTYADWGDVVLLDVDPSDPQRYRTPDGWRTFDRVEEKIAVAGAPDVREDVTWTIWGPLLAPDHRGRLRAYRWVAHSAEHLASTILPFEDAATIDDVIAQAHGLGTPGQNLVVVDATGRIGWTIYGSIPKRVALDGQLPSSWADGTRGWDGWLDPSEYPRIVDPAGGRIWTANARVIDGAGLALLGDGSYEVGSRAHVIRERLLAKNRFAPRDFLDIQLDTRAEFLDRWRSLLLATLTPAAIAGHASRAELRDLLEHGWSGKASPDSAAYRLTRGFRDLVSERVFAFVLAGCSAADPSFDYATVRKREGPLWAIVTTKPLHLLDPQYASWDAMLLDTIDRVISDATRGHSDGLSARVWSEVNVTSYRHPLSASIPFFGRWLDMPATPLPGDLYTPRVAAGAIGASERMVVSPGHEAEGIMHMPTGQSGHPLSPFYGNSHPAWVEGRATPFLPGPTSHTLMLTP